MLNVLLTQLMKIQILDLTVLQDQGQGQGQIVPSGLWSYIYCYHTKFGSTTVKIKGTSCKKNCTW
jgi:hypothetical protein